MSFIKRKYVVVVEDNPDHQMLLSRAINKTAHTPDVLMLNDGAELVEFIQNPYNRKPDLIILDIKMPKMSGLEALKRLKQSDYKTSPVLLMTTSNMRSDIVEAYTLGAASYICKSDNVMRWNCMLKEALDYWLGLNRTEESLGVG